MPVADTPPRTKCPGHMRRTSSCWQAQCPGQMRRTSPRRSVLAASPSSPSQHLSRLLAAGCTTPPGVCESGMRRTSARNACTG
eukprot:5874801-Alexandrium_andersonii.AAC.1